MSRQNNIINKPEPAPGTLGKSGSFWNWFWSRSGSRNGSFDGASHGLHRIFSMAGHAFGNGAGTGYDFFPTLFWVVRFVSQVVSILS